MILTLVIDSVNEFLFESEINIRSFCCEVNDEKLWMYKTTKSTHQVLQTRHHLPLVNLPSSTIS